MNHREIMDMFSCCNLGAVLVAEDNSILDINEAGKHLLGDDCTLLGQPLEQVASFLCQKNETPIFGNPAFNRYLLPCPSPELTTLPPGTRLLIFRDATKEFRYNLLENVLNYVSEAITVWDSECRMLMLNDAAAKLESHVINDVLGRHVSSLYEAENNSILVIPRLIKGKKPLLNLRQDFITHSGKELQIVSNNYPIVGDDKVLGAVSLMDDWTKLDEMNKRIIELQGTLIKQTKDPTARKVNALSAKYRFNDILYSGDTMRSVIDRCKQFARSDASVLIYGETGTGKELFAQSIHNASPRAGSPFLAINCAAIPETLLESMLFGTERGAYTGAERREGLFEQADGGTLLLDEINSMNITLQSKLLRFLQEGTFWRVGGSKLIQTDVRILSNINVPPNQAIKEERLRKDLYFRLGVINVTVPPLRERRDDIPLLSKTFIMTCNKKLLKNITKLSTATIELFYSYSWPGNVRELQHAIEYAMNIIPIEKDMITPEYIPDHILDAVEWERGRTHFSEEKPTMESFMQEAGRRFLHNALLENDGNISKAARALGISRQNLQHRMKKFGVYAEEHLPQGQ